jgi:hypothetical protein
VRYFYVLAKRELLAGQIADLLREATGIVTSVTGTEVCLELIYFPSFPIRQTLLLHKNVACEPNVCRKISKLSQTLRSHSLFNEAF